jgi:hypothetical protein
VKTHSADDSLAQPILDTLADSWVQRAAVRKDLLDYDEAFDVTRPDFPEHLVPFHDHPLFLEAAPAMRHQLLAGMWAWYNDKTIAIEEQIVNPGCRTLLYEGLAGLSDLTVKRALCETVVDEDYHILMCLEACGVSRRRRNIEKLVFDEPLLIRLRRDRMDETDLEWERNIISVAYMTVAELTINAYLKLLASDGTIQPLHRTVTSIHLRDESSHARMFREILKSVYRRMAPLEQRSYVQELRRAYRSFTAAEWAPWATVLSFVGCLPDQIAALEVHSRNFPASILRRDLISVVGFAEEIGVRPAAILGE